MVLEITDLDCQFACYLARWLCPVVEDCSCLLMVMAHVGTTSTLLSRQKRPLADLSKVVRLMGHLHFTGLQGALELDGMLL